MYYLFFGIHLLISFLIVVVVLLQRSKGGGLSGAFGGVGAGDAAFGSVGVTTFLHKTTIYLAIGFMVTSLSSRLHDGHAQLRPSDGADGRWGRDRAPGRRCAGDARAADGRGR